MNATYVIALLVGALLYWLTRYQRNFTAPDRLTFGEYLRYEWPAFIWGLIGAGIMYAVYAYAGEQVMLILGRVWSMFEGITVPAVNVLTAFLLGFGGKVFVDRLPRVANWFGTNIKLPGVK